MFLQNGVLPFLASLVPYFFPPVVQRVQVVFSFVTGTVVFHLFHTGILFFHIRSAVWKEISSRKWAS